MLDMSETTKAKSDQLNAADLIGAPMTITIAKVTKHDDDKQPIFVHYEGGEGRPWKPCLGMRRGLVAIWGVDGEKYTGRKLTLFCNPKVVYAGKEEGGIQISHASHIDKPVRFKLVLTRGKSTIHNVEPMADEQVCENKTHQEARQEEPKDFQKMLTEKLKADCKGNKNAMKAVFEGLTGVTTMAGYTEFEKLYTEITGDRRQEYVDCLGAIGMSEE